MSAWWMFMILVGCRLSHASQSQSTCACNDQLKTVCVPAGDNVLVPCPESAAEIVKFNLLQDGEIISNHTYNHGRNASNITPPHTRVGMELHKNIENKSFGFMLTGVNVNSHGIYRCESIVMFPPPLVSVPSNQRILVLIEGHQCNKVCHNDMTEQNCGSHWIWIIVLVSVYSTIVTISAIVSWVKLRRTDSQSDYMNTKPKASRDHRKKGGVKIPIPRHF